MRVEVDAVLCEGCGLCPEICPEVFAMGPGESGQIAYVRVAGIAEECEAACRDAAERCPVEAIRVDQDL